MFDLSFIKEFHLNLGPINIDLGDKEKRRNTAILLFIIGIVAFMFPGLPLGLYLPKFVNDFLSTVGLVFVIVGAILVQIR